MPILAVGLVLGSCVLHAFWNLLLKRARNKLAFTALYLSASPLLYLPLFLALIRGTRIPPAGWLCVGGTAAIYFGYFVGLAAAYEAGELSVAYPVIRGLGPALAFVGGALFLAERPTILGGCGVALILLGVFVLSRRAQPSAAASSSSRAAPSLLIAVFVALTYCGYSLVDKIVVGRLHVNPAVYLYLTMSLSAALVVPWAIRRVGARAVREEWRTNGAACVAVGGLNMFAYTLVLIAMSLPRTPIGYITPLRAVSVLFGVVFGARVLNEGRLAAKLGAAGLMMAGIALMAWKG